MDLGNWESKYSVCYFRFFSQNSRVKIPVWFSRKAITLVGLYFFLFVSMHMASGAVLTHRYSFNGNTSDSIGAANGTLVGNAVIANGALVLDGTNSCMQIPNDLFTNYDSASIEIWFQDVPVTAPTAQLYNFSGTNGGMNYTLAGTGAYWIGSTTNPVSLPIPAVAKTNHLVWTQDNVSKTAQLYINGVLITQKTNFTFTPSAIGSTTNNLIGAGKTNIPSFNFKGNIHEFRTYQGALTPLEVAELDAFGPEQPLSDSGVLQQVRLVILSPTGPGAIFRPGVFADFLNVTNVNISTQPDLVLTSDNTNVIAITSDQLVQTPGYGSATVTATWQGMSNSVPVTVAVPQDVSLIHRYTFNEQTNDWIVYDSCGDAHGRIFNPIVSSLFGGPHLSTTNAFFTTNGELKLAGFQSYPNSSGGYAALPAGIISTLSEVSLETWVTWTPGNVSFTDFSGAWQRIFDFGSQSPGPYIYGVSYLFLTPASGSSSTQISRFRSAITTNSNGAENPILNWTNMLPTNVLVCVGFTYSPAKGIVKMYLNGSPVASGTAVIPLAGIVDTNCWLGRSQFSSDAYFNGSYSEFRIYKGLLSDADMAADYAAGLNTIGVDYVLHTFASSNSLSITWGTSVTNLVLKTSPVLGDGAVWTPVPDVPVIQNGRYSVAVPILSEAAFYRLQTP